MKKAQKLLMSDLKSDVAKVYNMEDVNEAVKYYTENILRGKVLLKPFHAEEK